ncbi:MAG TPA: Spy/CpxP family protein refolding chaperone [Vicinamibacterales bacterium]|nr:Spy/CpxP family protein refolding chaperone [Vicinamibacterales bacterium]
MKKLAFSAVLATVLGVAAFSLADAQSDGQRPGRGPGFGPGPGGRGLIPFARVVDLTEDQRTQIRSILQQAREGRDAGPAGAALHRQLEAELFADVPDEQKIEQLKEQLAQAQAQGLARRIELQKQIAQVLTPEQRAKVREELAKTPARGGRRGPARQGAFSIQ